ncbi:MAG: hypothetical protein ACD_57C00001G0002 [uncultured bacterium]|uniref:Uncharacterized protein n=1 Tax=Candidatus Nomurabacteria bacterium GW2011_GWA1_46_11 TaxID=1618732 RepID=A0A0G1RN79_9BACT|nr:MAG: hypothetical protein ACD_57C00001G0002 [uncultured bacterium]KKT78325.1 MAG: hypothetical protein UW73_C0004G0049 [Microgenomates group bacterium GW2011_GWB1_44_8]KKU22385.1 MAG: hypothetical protein UX31_C0003G0051 [Candidatus Nomurabacteria bacterium GW2011_GWA1_46_11]
MLLTMLTKGDFSQIKKIVDESLDGKLETALDQKLDEKLQPIKQDIESALDRKLDEKLRPIKGELGDIVEKQLKPIKRDVRHIRRVLDETIVHFDQRVTTLEKKVDRAEDHLHLPHSI